MTRRHLILLSRFLIFLFMISCCGMSYLVSKTDDEKEKKQSRSLNTFQFGNKVLLGSTLLLSARSSPAPVTKMNFISPTWFEQEPKLDQPTTSSPVQAVLIPHAGYRYSGEVIAETLKKIDGLDPHIGRVVLLSTLHQRGHNYQLGKEHEAINIPHREGSLELQHIPGLDCIEENNKEVFEQEHSWQLMLPLVAKLNEKRKQLLRKPLKVAPLLIGAELEITPLLNYLKRFPNTIIIANTDLLHCKGDCPEDPKDFDRHTLQSIREGINKNQEIPHHRDGKATMCGRYAVKALRELARALHLWAAYDSVQSDSRQAKGQNGTGRYVGYAGLSFIPLQKLPQKVLQDHFSAHSSPLSRDPIDQRAQKYSYRVNRALQGIFVTIKKGGRLRGCIGTFRVDRDKNHDLGYYIAAYTLESAFKDARFASIEESELEELTFEITLLDKPFPIYSKQKEKKLRSRPSPSDAFVGAYRNDHGITISFQDGSSPTFLASVLQERAKEYPEKKALFAWTEQALRQKAGTNQGSAIKKVELYLCQPLSKFLSLAS